MRQRGFLSHYALPGTLALALVGCGKPTNFVGGETVDSRYTTGGGQFDSGPAIYVLARLKELNGFTGICALWTTQSTNANVQNEFENAAAGIKLQLDGETLFFGVENFPRAAFRANMTGANTSCAQTERPWQSGDAGRAPEIVATRYQARPNQAVIVRFGPADLPSLVP